MPWQSLQYNHLTLVKSSLSVYLFVSIIRKLFFFHREIAFLDNLRWMTQTAVQFRMPTQEGENWVGQECMPTDMGKMLRMAPGSQGKGGRRSREKVASKLCPSKWMNSTDNTQLKRQTQKCVSYDSLYAKYKSKPSQPILLKSGEQMIFYREIRNGRDEALCRQHSAYWSEFWLHGLFCLWNFSMLYTNEHFFVCILFLISKKKKRHLLLAKSSFPPSQIWEKSYFLFLKFQNIIENHNHYGGLSRSSKLKLILKVLGLPSGEKAHQYSPFSLCLLSQVITPY